jgi:hypothetical protein
MRSSARSLTPWIVAALLLLSFAPIAHAVEAKAKVSAPAPAESRAKADTHPAPAPATSAEAPAGETESEEAEKDEQESVIDAPSDRDKVAVWSDVEIPADQVIPGDVVCIGGKANVQGKVHGDVVVIAGSLDMPGSAGGSVVGVGSKLVLHSGTSVRRDVVNVAGSLDRGGATVGGKVINIGLGGKWFSHLPGPFGMLGFFLFWAKLLKLVLVFLGLIVLTALVPDRIRLMGEEAPLRPFMAFFAGLGGYVILVLTMILLCITIIGIPAALLLYFAFVVVKWMGLASFFFLVGRRIGRLLGREMSLLGAILLGFLPFAILRFLPFCIGTLIWFVLEAMAVGLVILTRGGGRRYGMGPAAPVPAPPVPTAPSPAP